MNSGDTSYFFIKNWTFIEQHWCWGTKVWVTFPQAFRKYLLNLIFLCKIYKEELIIQCTAFFFFNFIFYVILFIIFFFIYLLFYFFSGCSEAIAIFCFWGHGRSVHVATLGNASPTTMHTRFVYIENLWSTYRSFFRLWIFSPAIGRVLIIIINYIS